VDQLRVEHAGNVSSLIQKLALKKGLTEKWALNFLAALILSGGGQRPQVYAHLQLPHASELDQYANDLSGKKQYFSVRAGHEKTTRSIDLPKVLFPRMMHKFIQFHVLKLRPVILHEVFSPVNRPSRRQRVEHELIEMGP
jgi:hypothetical protein